MIVEFDSELHKQACQAFEMELKAGLQAAIIAEVTVYVSELGTDYPTGTLHQVTVTIPQQRYDDFFVQVQVLRGRMYVPAQAAKLVKAIVALWAVACELDRL
jgi:hypothetical protein